MLILATLAEYLRQRRQAGPEGFRQSRRRAWPYHPTPLQAATCNRWQQLISTCSRTLIYN